MRMRDLSNRLGLGLGLSLLCAASIVGISAVGCQVSTNPGGTDGTGGSNGGGSGGTNGDSGTGGSRSCPASSTGTLWPCDIYAADGGPCVAAHSTVRALFGAYNGPLYQVRRASDGMTMDIGVDSPGGFAKSEDQDSFCGTGNCTISVIYDQSSQHNDLLKAPAGMRKTTPGNEANAKSAPATFGGHKVYGVHIVTGIGYRDNNATGTAEHDDAETEYMVVGGGFYNGGCCFDYGNMERNSSDNGEGTMEAVYYGTCTIWGKGAGDGPWVMGDLENGLWAGNISPYSPNVPVTFRYVTGMVKGDDAGKNHWTIKVGDATTGCLATPFDGQRPSSRYNPMRKEGAIGLGTGGDNSNADQGNFFEGVMTAHYSSDKADDDVQASVVAVYGQQ